MRRTTARSLWGALVAVGVVLGVSAVPATADVRGPGRPHPATWLGSYATFGGDPWAWCVDAGRAEPDAGLTWSGEDVAAPTVGYLLTRHASDTSAENHAALSYLVHTSPELPHDPRTPVPVDPPSVSGIDLPGRVAALRADAARHAGPYTVRLSLEPAADGRSGAVRGALVSASGHAVPDRQATVSLDGPAVFAGGVTSLEVTTTGEDSSWDWTATATGTVTATLVVSAPQDTVVLHRADVPGVQRVVTPKEPGPVRASAQAEVRLPFSPQVRTRTSAAVAAEGDPLADELEVSVADADGGVGGWAPQVVVTVRSTLWGPFAERPGEADGPPEGAGVVGTVETVVDGPGTYLTSELVLPGPGYYVWTEEIAPDESQLGWRGRFGLRDETTVVPWTPQVTTQVSDQSAAVGATVTDTLAVSGLPDGFGDADVDDTRLVVTLYGPFAEPPGEGDCSGEAPVVGTQELVARNGTLVTDGFGPLPAPGWYTFVERLGASERVAGHTGPCGAVTETTFVPAPPDRPAVPPVAPPAPEPPVAEPPAAEPPAAVPPVAVPPVEVQRPAPPRPVAPAPPSLPKTGADGAVTGVAGAVLVSLGALLVLASGAGRPPRSPGQPGAATRHPGAHPGWTPIRPSARP